MATRSGIAAQVGWASESAYGTFAAPDRFVPLVSESLALTIERLESAGIVAGRFVLDDDAWFPGARSVAGDLTIELYALTIGELLEHALGAVSTTGTDPYTHTFTPAATWDKSLTVQVGRPDIGGTVRPFSYTGCKISGWEISASAGELARMVLNLVGQDEATDESLASASYATGLKPFTFIQGTVTIAGSAIKVKSATLRGSNPMDTDRRFLGQNTADQPIDNALREITGDLVAEFASLTDYARFTAGTTAALVLEFDDGTNSLTATLNVRFDGTTPNVSGREVLEQALPIKAIGSTDAAAITIELVNSDATA